MEKLPHRPKRRNIPSQFLKDNCANSVITIKHTASSKKAAAVSLLLSSPLIVISVGGGGRG